MRRIVVVVLLIGIVALLDWIDQRWNDVVWVIHFVIMVVMMQ